MRSILEYDTVALNEEEKALVIVDQTLLPGEIRLLHLTAQNEIWEAIKVLRVRGAPAIGVTAAWGCVLALHGLPPGADWPARLDAALEALAQAGGRVDQHKIKLLLDLPHQRFHTRAGYGGDIAHLRRGQQRHAARHAQQRLLEFAHLFQHVHNVVHDLVFQAEEHVLRAQADIHIN